MMIGPPDSGSEWTRVWQKPSSQVAAAITDTQLLHWVRERNRGQETGKHFLRLFLRVMGVSAKTCGRPHPLGFFPAAAAWARTKLEPLEPLVKEPQAEPGPQEPFFRNQTWNLAFLFTVRDHREPPFPRGAVRFDPTIPSKQTIGVNTLGSRKWHWWGCRQL